MEFFVCLALIFFRPSFFILRASFFSFLLLSDAFFYILYFRRKPDRFDVRFLILPINYH